MGRQVATSLVRYVVINVYSITLQGGEGLLLLRVQAHI